MKNGFQATEIIQGKGVLKKQLVILSYLLPSFQGENEMSRKIYYSYIYSLDFEVKPGGIQSIKD